MSDTYVDEGEDQTEDEELEQQPQGKTPKELREAADRASQYRKERDEARKALAFLSAGVDVKTDLGKLIMRGYEGDLTPEAIQSFVEALGVTAPAEEPPEEKPEEGEKNQTKEREELAGDSTPPGAEPEPDPIATGMKDFREDLSQGMTRDDAASEFLKKMFDAASKGDERVISKV